MIERMILLAASALFIRLVLLLVEVALTPATRLRLSLFRPWRGDPWPIGVQEDDDLHFRWRAALVQVAGAAPQSAAIAGRRARRTLPREAPVATGEPTIEDLPDGTVATQRPDRVTVHRSRR
jgi:hypothetical protein